MENEGFKMRIEDDKDNISLRLLFFILVITMALSLVVSYVIVNFSGPAEKGYSSDSGRIIVDVVDEKSEKLFSMAGKIVVDVVEGNEGDGEG